MNVQHVICGLAVNESENLAIQQLKSRLISVPGNEEWKLLTNLAFSANHHLQSDEIDIVAIGPSGVRVIEVKHWTASWVNQNADLVEHEADRLMNKAKKIGSTLRKKVADLPFVKGVFLVTQDASKTNPLVDQTVRGVPFSTIKTWESAVGFGEPKELSTHQIEYIAKSLSPRNGVSIDGKLPRLANYVHMELQTDPKERFHRIYKATHATRQEGVILHLYDMSAQSGSNVEAVARREFDVLQRLHFDSWAPRIVDSFQEVPGYWGELHFFTTSDPAAPALYTRAADESWGFTERLEFVRNTIKALSDLHEAGTSDAPIVHRNLTVNSILVKHDNSPILTGFEFSRIPLDVTVGSKLPVKDSNSTVAPEVLHGGLHAADHRSDIYSLCACLNVLFEGLDDELSHQTQGVLKSGMNPENQKRSSLKELASSIAELAGETVVSAVVPAARYWTEEQVVSFHGRDYRIVARLGTGGIGSAFKVVEVGNSSGEDLGTYVAKVIHEQKAGNQAVSAYSLARSHLGGHPALSTLFEIAQEWREDEFTALMTWIEGAPIRDFIGVFQLLAEEQDGVSSEDLALHWLQIMCEALHVFHSNGLVHGDVSPANMIVSGEELVLTDYDGVRKIGDSNLALGTGLYGSPKDHENGGPLPSDDIYALAASFFHVLFDTAPFQYDSGLSKELGLNWSGVSRSEFPIVAKFLDKATHPNLNLRYRSAHEALECLKPLSKLDSENTGFAEKEPSDLTIEDKTGQVPVERSEQKVLWLQELLQSYPGSAKGNRETRGLDSSFAEKTYVETEFERKLFQELKARKVKLVVLCGNAGDGKTALLQHLAKRFKMKPQDSSTRIVSGRTSDGLVVQMNLDGSASWEGRSADEILDQFLEPFQNGPPRRDVVHLLAINDGRLLEWLAGVVEQRGDTQLTEDLYAFLDAEHEQGQDFSTVNVSQHIRFVSLNQRSLVGSISTDKSAIIAGFLESLLDRLYGAEKASEIWLPCQSCSAQERCEVFRATAIFGPEGTAGKATQSLEIRTHAREQLFSAFQAVHLRGETHITVRELRAALVYILFGIHSCQDYHAGSKESEQIQPQPFWNRAFSPQSPVRQGDLLRELARFDPALESHPQIDRILQQEATEHEAAEYPSGSLGKLESVRRQAYFEWPKDKIQRLTDDPNALDLAQGRHLSEFRELAFHSKPEERLDLVKRLCRGISRLEDLPLQAMGNSDVVSLRITPRTPTESAFWVEKSISEFSLEPDFSGNWQGLDRLHRQAFLTYRFHDGHKEKLRLGADLFHLLLDLSDGYQLGDVSTDDTFAHLSVFVQRLIREDHRKVLAWSPMKEDAVFEVAAKKEDSEQGPRQSLAISLVKPI